MCSMYCLMTVLVKRTDDENSVFNGMLEIPANLPRLNIRILIVDARSGVLAIKKN